MDKGTCQPTWRPGPADPSLDGAEIHVWAATLEVTAYIIEQFAATLAPGEMERAGRFHFALHRKRFIAGRGLLRELLGRYLRIDPAEVQFAYGPNGKPRLANQCRLEFNLAHSEDLAVIALTRGGLIGIDVEQIRPLEDATELVARFFSRRESAIFGKLPPNLQSDAFFNLWTRKEAWLKATGEGIGHLLGKVEVSFLAGEPPELLSLPPGASESIGWRLRGLRPAPGFVAAFATTAPPARLECWAWSEPARNAIKVKTRSAQIMEATYEHANHG